MDPGDNLTVDTPEQIALEFQIAGIGSRFLALAIDTLIQSALYFLVILAFTLVPALSFAPSLGPWYAAILVVTIFCLYWGYFAAFEVIWKGQTPGKRVLKIRVIKDNGRPINVYEAIGRNLMRVIDSVGLYGVGLITMALNRNNRRLGDFVAGTVVVHERVDASVRPDWIAAPAEQTHQPAVDLSKLDTRDLELVETFLHRRYQLQGYVRIQTADQILKHIRAKADLGPSENEGPETFLERIARDLRNQARFVDRR